MQAGSPEDKPEDIRSTIRETKENLNYTPCGPQGGASAASLRKASFARSLGRSREEPRAKVSEVGFAARSARERRMLFEKTRTNGLMQSPN
jgi:hypothetical protein